MAMCWRSLGNADRFKHFLDLAQERNPEDVTVLRLLGLQALDGNRLEAAESLLRKAVNANPSSYLANYALFLCLERRGKKDEAHLYKSRCAQLKRDLEGLPRILKALAAKPNDSSLRYQLGMFFLAHAKRAEGIQWLHRVLEEDPHHKLAHKALANYYKDNGQQALARKHQRLAR
jgi:Tfp pilus assembly protein PilF